MEPIARGRINGYSYHIEPYDNAYTFVLDEGVSLGERNWGATFKTVNEAIVGARAYCEKYGWNLYSEKDGYTISLRHWAGKEWGFMVNSSSSGENRAGFSTREDAIKAAKTLVYMSVAFHNREKGEMLCDGIEMIPCCNTLPETDVYSSKEDTYFYLAVYGELLTDYVFDSVKSGHSNTGGNFPSGNFGQNPYCTMRCYQDGDANGKDCVVNRFGKVVFKAEHGNQNVDYIKGCIAVCDDKMVAILNKGIVINYDNSIRDGVNKGCLYTNESIFVPNKINERLVVVYQIDFETGNYTILK